MMFNTRQGILFCLLCEIFIDDAIWYSRIGCYFYISTNSLSLFFTLSFITYEKKNRDH